MSAAEATVGIDPVGAELLVRELHEAERLVSEAAAEVRAALADAGVASFAAVELEEISAWCRAQATDFGRRAGAVDEVGLKAGAAASIFDHDEDITELRGNQAVVLLGLGTEEPELQDWLAAQFPDLVARREQVRPAMAALRRARAALSVDAYVGGSADATSDERMSQLSRRERAQAQQAQATAAEMERFLAGLDDEQVRQVAEAVLEALATKEAGGRAAEVAEALAPLRSRLRDRLAEAARQAYMGGSGRRPLDVEGLSELYQGLGFERRRSTNAFTEFAAGLFLGDFGRSDGTGATSTSRTLGHLASGLFAVGDVRDTLAAVTSGHWGDAGLAAFGAIPVAGDLAKAADAADDTARAARRADDAAGTAQRGADEMAAALRGTPLEGWNVGDPMANAAGALVDPRKFHDYSMNEGNRRNGGKYKAFAKVGYEVGNEQGPSCGRCGRGCPGARSSC